MGSSLTLYSLQFKEITLSMLSQEIVLPCKVNHLAMNGDSTRQVVQVTFFISYNGFQATVMLHRMQFHFLTREQ